MLGKPASKELRPVEAHRNSYDCSRDGRAQPRPAAFMMTRGIPRDFHTAGVLGVESGDQDVTDEISHSAGPKYSIVIPAFNESARIPATLSSVLDCIRARGWCAEVLVVNDGSTDATAEVVRAFARTAPEVRLIENPGNRGKGYSVRAGMLQARGEVALFTDADLSAPIEEAERLFAAIREGADIAIGSRWLESARQTHRQPLFRQFFGRCFNAVTRAVMRLPFADTQCGLKAFRSEE